MKKFSNFLQHLFTPLPENNYRAKALHHDFLTFYLVLAFFLTFFSKTTGNYLKNILGFATDISIDKIYQLTNEQRQKYQLPSLTYNEKLAQAAYLKAQDMFVKNYWSHYAPDGASPWSFILATNYRYDYAGENLAKNFMFSQDVVNAWMNSPTHRDNILKKEYTEIGIAVVNGVLNGEETTLVVQMFGKPLEASMASKKIPPSWENVTPVEKTEKITVNNQPQITKNILAKQENPVIKVNVANLSFDFVYVFIFFLLIVLATDFYIASSMNIVRIHGKNLGHFIFLGFVFLGLILFFTKGSII
ncbi:MAG: CAP domain-containing protein [Microgenomates group bacterium]|nr:CAP domain-containing protein [Microgenomates group bacterium]